MAYLFRKLFENRDSIALNLFVCGAPLIYFFRDTVGLAPNSSLFTALFTIGPLFFAFSFKNIKFFFRPNPTLYLLSLTILGFLVLYLFLKDPYSGIGVKPMSDYLVYTIIFFIYFYLLFVKLEDINKNFIFICLFLCFTGAIVLLTVVLNDPTYVLGQRAALRFGNQDLSANPGNPHIHSKNAFLGVIICLILFKRVNQFKINPVIPLAALLLFIVVLFLTQTLVAILATLIFLGSFLVFNFHPKKILLGAKNVLFRWYVIVVVIAGVIKIGAWVNKNEMVLNGIKQYVTNRIDKVSNTIFSSSVSKSTSKEKVDDSANNRVEMFKYFTKNLQENFDEGRLRYIFFGNGYKTMYMDNPFLETFDSYGFFIFILYSILTFYMTWVCIKEARNPRSTVTEFLAYAFIYYFLQNFTGGLLLDQNRWGFFAIICRFFTQYKIGFPPNKID